MKGKKRVRKLDIMLKESGTKLRECVSFNVKNEPIKINFNKFLEIYVEYFPTIHQEASNFYFQYPYKKGRWVKKSILQIIKHIRKIVNVLYPYFWEAKFNREIEEILPLVCKAVEKLEKPEDYINLKNGLFSLNSFELEPHRKEIFSTTQLNFSYDAEAECPTFEKFLDDVFLGDKELKRILQEAFGYGLSSQVTAQKFFILFSEGSSGKSVACEILKHLAGGNEQVSTVTLGDLGNKFQRSQLYGKVVNISTENEVRRFNTQALKSITSGDTLQLEFKGKDPFTDVITAKLFFAVNRLPDTDDKSFAYMRRVVLIPFLARFVDVPDETKKDEKKRDPNIKESLLKELPGIFNWAMRGLKRLKKNNYQFTKSKTAEEILKIYNCEVNPVCSFIEEMISAEKKSEVTQTDLYDAYTVWAKKNGEKLDNKRNFLKDLRQNLREAKISFRERRSNSKRYFIGIKIKNASSTIMPSELDF